MKINRSMLAVVAMMLGSLSAMGCKQSAAQGAPQEAATAPAQISAATEAPAESPAPAPEPVKAASIGPSGSPLSGIVSGPSGASFVRPPPPLRVEVPGPAPSPDFTFVRGLWALDGHDYRWVPGRWEARRDADEGRRPARVKVGGRWTVLPWRGPNGHDRDDHRDRGDHRDHPARDVGVSVTVRAHT